MALETYRKKRRFDRTPEPEGEATPDKSEGESLAFVIQKHDATRLHYDFRLELDGVMKSWAIPKGPSLDPAVKRMAVHVEDHPIEYNTFEGVIPKGEYGGGPVLLWDRGRWIPEEDPRAGYKKGSLKFRLEGEKLHGSWALVRTNYGQRGRDGGYRAQSGKEISLRGPELPSEPGRGGSLPARPEPRARPRQGR